MQERQQKIKKTKDFMWNWCRISCRNPGRPCLCGFFLEHIFLYTSGDKNGRCCVLLIHNRGCNWKAVPADCWKACFQAEKAAPRTAETGKNVIVIQDIVILWCILFASMLIYWRKRCWCFVLWLVTVRQLTCMSRKGDSPDCGYGKEIARAKRGGWLSSADDASITYLK